MQADVLRQAGQVSGVFGCSFPGGELVHCANVRNLVDGRSGGDYLLVGEVIIEAMKYDVEVGVSYAHSGLPCLSLKVAILNSFYSIQIHQHKNWFIILELILHAQFEICYVAFGDRIIHRYLMVKSRNEGKTLSNFKSR